MNQFRILEKRLANHIRMCGELACLLEVSATPKPGNVHRFRDFEEIRYEDFLASSVSLGVYLEELALKGLAIKREKLTFADISLGKTIKNAIQHANFFHQRTNTNLGIILLLTPLSVAAGLSINPKLSTCKQTSLKKAVAEVMFQTSVEDAILVSEGIIIANPGGLGTTEEYDLKDSNLTQQLLDDKVTLYQLMETCVSRDTICSELVNNYDITFNVGLKKLNDSLLIGKDINLAIIDAYLEVLATYPDTLIKRKFGTKVAKEVSSRASEILKLGGALTVDGRRELEEFDIELREDEKINPGTTADIIAATVFIYLLLGGKI